MIPNTQTSLVARITTTWPDDSEETGLYRVIARDDEGQVMSDGSARFI